MTEIKRNYLIALLAVSATLLASLIPGGPIENRDFSHIDVRILGGFNLFLTVLNLGTFALLYSVFRTRRWALTVAWFAGLAYFVVYAIDLAQIFPRSPTPMSEALLLIEVLGMSVAVPLMYLSWPYTPFARHERARHDIDVANRDSVAEVSSPTGLRMMLFALVLVLGIGIIFFATDSAMNPSDSTELLTR